MKKSIRDFPEVCDHLERCGFEYNKDADDYCRWDGNEYDCDGTVDEGYTTIYYAVDDKFYKYEHGAGDTYGSFDETVQISYEEILKL